MCVAHNVDNWGTYSKFSVTKLINPEGVDKAVLTQSLLRMASSTSHVNAITGSNDQYQAPSYHQHQQAQTQPHYLNKQTSASQTNLNQHAHLMNQQRANLPATYLDVINVKTSPRAGLVPPIETISTTTTKKTVSSSSSSSHFMTTHSAVPVPGQQQQHHRVTVSGPTFQPGNGSTNIHVTRQF